MNTQSSDPYALRQTVGSGTGTTVSAQNKRGEWVPAIPLPLFVWWRNRCDCGAKFWTGRGYRGHYALAHILGQD